MGDPGRVQGVQGARSDPLASSSGGPERSDVSDTATARSAGDLPPVSGQGEASAADAKRRRRGSPHLDTRFDEAALSALRTRARRLGVDPSAWVRAVVSDTLDVRRTAEVDAAVAARTVEALDRAQPSADARHLAAQLRPLAINVNDLDRQARAGESVVLGADGAELVALLREARELLGDRLSS